MEAERTGKDHVGDYTDFHCRHFAEVQVWPMVNSIGHYCGYNQSLPYSIRVAGMAVVAVVAAVSIVEPVAVLTVVVLTVVVAGF